MPHLPEDLFPGGAKAGWLAVAVQLDLEAKGVIKLEEANPFGCIALNRLKNRQRCVIYEDE